MKPANSSSIYWAGSYPHNRISAGVNTLLRRRQAAFKVAFNRPHVDAMVQGLRGAIAFNYEVQAELAEASRQLAHHGLSLLVQHDTTELHGNLALSLDEGASVPHGIRVYEQPGQRDLQPIWINGLASRLLRLQRDALSGRFNMAYEDVDAYLTGSASDLFDAFTVGQRHPPPRPATASHSWFSILAPTHAAGLEIWVPDPSSQRSETVQISQPDLHLLAVVFPEAVRTAQQFARLGLASLELTIANGRWLRFMLPIRQLAELCDAVAAACRLQQSNPGV